MKNLVALILACIFISGCCTTGKIGVKDKGNVETLRIEWQRFVSESGSTCSRCELTQKEVKKAFKSLKESLSPLGIKVVLEEKELDDETCAQDISQSNRIWIGERPLEEWLDAEVGKSHCEGCCSELGTDVECRTIEVDGQTYEKIPTELIIKAGLVAASEKLSTGQDKPCCPEKSCEKPCLKTTKGCCP